jgi:hypothetical protein
LNAFSRRSLLKAEGLATVCESGSFSVAYTFAFESDDSAITSFIFHTPEVMLGDLRLHLEHMQFPERETCNNWRKAFHSQSFLD